MDYIIAIPTYKRYKTLREKTLRLLNQENFDKNRIYIFFANDDEKNKYNLSDEYINQIVGVFGLTYQRNFIVNYFPNGQKILWLDDDLMEINTVEIDPNRADKRHNLRFKKSTIKQMADIGFEQLDKHKCSLFGVYPVSNPGFMKIDYISTDLKYIIGCCYGTINNQELFTFDVFEHNGGAKEDYLRTLMVYDVEHMVIRLNHFHTITNYYKEAGGLQSIDEFGTRYDRDMISMKYICKKYPYYAFEKIQNNYPEIKLHDKIKIKNQTTLF